MLANVLPLLGSARLRNASFATSTSYAARVPGRWPSRESIARGHWHLRMKASSSGAVAFDFHSRPASWPPLEPVGVGLRAELGALLRAEMRAEAERSTITSCQWYPSGIERYYCGCCGILRTKRGMEHASYFPLRSLFYLPFPLLSPPRPPGWLATIRWSRRNALVGSLSTGWSHGDSGASGAGWKSAVWQKRLTVRNGSGWVWVDSTGYIH